MVDVFEADGGIVGGGGADEDIGTVENLLDDGSLKADTANFVQTDGFVLLAEDAAAGGACRCPRALRRGRRRTGSGRPCRC